MQIAYGVPYQGSKNFLAERIIQALPSATHFYDVFAGGCAITHAAILSGKYKVVHASDIGDAPLLFRDAYNGTLGGRANEWVSREDFFAAKDYDPYIRLCWSFGNNGQEYLYAKALEPLKKAFFYALVKQDYTLIREIWPDYPRVISYYHLLRTNHLYMEFILAGYERKYGISPHGYFCKSTNALVVVSYARRLRQIHEAWHVVRPLGIQLKVTTGIDYRNIAFERDSVIYCDPPYAGTAGYNRQKFDSGEFWRWAEGLARQGCRVFISELEAGSVAARPVLSIPHRYILSATNNTKRVMERLYTFAGCGHAARRQVQGRLLEACAG